MSKVEGQPLHDLWLEIPEDSCRHVINQLHQFITQWRELQSGYYGTIGRGPCEDIFFKHLSFRPRTNPIYGHYTARHNYNEGFVKAFYNSRPSNAVAEDE